MGECDKDNTVRSMEKRLHDLWYTGHDRTDANHDITVAKVPEGFPEGGNNPYYLALSAKE